MWCIIIHEGSNGQEKLVAAFEGIEYGMEQEECL